MKQLLIVDDNPTNLKLLEILLNKQGCNVVHFSSTDDCIAWFQQYKPKLDLSIFDYEIDQRNGYQLATELKTLGLNGNCILLTALGSLDYAEFDPQVIKAIFNKPINLSDVTYMLKRWTFGSAPADARSEPRKEEPPEDGAQDNYLEAFHYQAGTYHTLQLAPLNSSKRGKGYRLIQGTPPMSGTEIVLPDGQNYSIRWVRTDSDSTTFGTCRIEPVSPQ